MLRKRTYLLLFSILLIAMTSVGCSNSEKSDDAILQKAEAYFDVREKLSNINITPEEYKNESIKLFAEPEFLDSILIYRKDESHSLSVLEFKNSSQESLQEHKKYLEELRSLFKSPITQKEVKISGVYDDPNSDDKYVYTLSMTEDKSVHDGKLSRGYSTSRIRFIKTASDWKISLIDRDAYNYREGDDINGKTEQDMVDNMLYRTHNNEPVEYIIEKDLLKNKKDAN